MDPVSGALAALGFDPFCAVAALACAVIGTIILGALMPKSEV
jgi:hypothetical protein